MKTLRLFNPDREPFSDLLLFDGAVRAEVADVLGCSQVCRADPGEVVLAAGVLNAMVYVVLQGTLRVDLALAEEGDAAYLGRGECVGELSVIDGSLTSTSVRAVDECDLLALQGADILTLADRSHAVARNLLRILTRRLRGTNARLRVEANQSETLRVRSLTDALTGLHNRGWLDDTLRRMVVRVDRGDAPFALLIADVDHFKTFNDTWGHLVGDRVLQQVAETLRVSLRPTDFAARYGGEEFALVLPAVSDLGMALGIAERVCRAVRETVMLPDRGADSPRVTISIGGAVHQPGEAVETLIHRADQLLYRAKQEGRDRAVC